MPMDATSRYAFDNRNVASDLLEDDSEIPSFEFFRRESVTAKVTGVVVQDDAILTSFIIGHATNGTLGTGNGNVFGDQKEGKALRSHVNSLNRWKEPLFNNDFVDTGNTDATMDYSAHTATGASTSTKYLYTKDIYMLSGTNINQVKVSECTETTPGASSITWHASTDEGSTWDAITFGSFTAVTAGDSLRVRATLTAPAADLPLVTAGVDNEIKIEYTNA